MRVWEPLAKFNKCNSFYLLFVFAVLKFLTFVLSVFISPRGSKVFSIYTTFVYKILVLVPVEI